VLQTGATGLKRSERDGGRCSHHGGQASPCLTFDIMLKTRFILSELKYFSMFFGQAEEHV
jgi:hypothetical protein